MMMMVMTIMASPWLEIHVVASGHREAAALKLILIYVAEIQN